LAQMSADRHLLLLLLDKLLLHGAPADDNGRDDGDQVMRVLSGVVVDLTPISTASYQRFITYN
jgi:hypothetical protein